MEFQIIKNSESNTGYNIPDKTYFGVIPGYYCGWQFEFKHADGRIDYSSVDFYPGTPEDYCNSWLEYGPDALFTIERTHGWEPTGRVIFRGYYDHGYDWEEREDYFTDVPDEILKQIEGCFGDGSPLQTPIRDMVS